MIPLLSAQSRRLRTREIARFLSTNQPTERFESHQGHRNPHGRKRRPPPPQIRLSRDELRNLWRILGDEASTDNTEENIDDVTRQEHEYLERMREAAFFRDTKTISSDGDEAQLSTHSILLEWHEKYKSDPDTSPKPTLEAHMLVLQGLHEVPDSRQKACQATEILRLLLEVKEPGIPVVDFYECVVDVWLKASQQELLRPTLEDVQTLIRRAKQAEELLVEVQRSATFNMYHSVLRCYQRAAEQAATLAYSKGEELLEIAMHAADAALDLVNTKMDRGVDLDAIKVILACYCTISTPAAMSNVEALLDDLSDEQFLDTEAYRIILEAYADKAHLAAEFDENDEDHVANRAVRVLERMEKEMLVQGDSNDVVPDNLCYGAVLKTLATCKGQSDDESSVPMLAMKILRRMERLYDEERLNEPPDVNCYGQVILAWSLCPDSSRAANESERLLERLEAATFNESQHQVHPKEITRYYNTVLQLLSKVPSSADAPQRAESIYARMHGFRDVRSSLAVIACLARHPKPLENRISRALAVLDTMPQPTMAAMNMILKVCAVSVEERDLALQVTDHIRNQIVKPKYATYGRLCQVYHAHYDVGKERDDLLRRVFEDALVAGEVHDLVLAAFKEAASDDLVNTMLGVELDAKLEEGTVRLEDLPSALRETRQGDSDDQQA